MNLSFLNPYELLGVTVDSDISSLTKNYYKLALLCHPDKGGNPDDMNVLHTSYLYIKEQLKVVNVDKKLEDFENEFSEFCKIQEAIPAPKFSEIFTENPFTSDFNREFEKMNRFKWITDDSHGNGGYVQEIHMKRYPQEKSHIESSDYENLFRDGYGDLMEKSDINNMHQLEQEQEQEQENKEQQQEQQHEQQEQQDQQQEQQKQDHHDEDQPYVEQTEVENGSNTESSENPFFTYKTHEPRQSSIVIKYDSKEPSLLTPIRHTFNRELIRYVEPEALSDSCIDNNIRFDLKKIKDFSCFVSKDLYCSDYLIAHSTNSIIDDKDTDLLKDRPQTLEELIALRGGASRGTSCPPQPPPA